MSKQLKHLNQGNKLLNKMCSSLLFWQVFLCHLGSQVKFRISVLSGVPQWELPLWKSLDACSLALLPFSLWLHPIYKGPAGRGGRGPGVEKGPATVQHGAGKTLSSVKNKPVFLLLSSFLLFHYGHTKAILFKFFFPSSPILKNFKYSSLNNINLYNA